MFANFKSMKYILLFIVITFTACKTQEKSFQSSVDNETLIQISAFQAKDLKTDNERMQSILNSLRYTENSRIIVNGKEFPGKAINSIIDTLGEDYSANVKTDTVKNIKYLIFSKNEKKQN